MKLFILLVLFIFTSISFANEEGKKEVVPDFNNIKEVLENDNLEAPLKEKMAREAAEKKRKAIKEFKKFTFPVESDFWSFLSEYWLVKNAPVVKWDFQKPDYGLESYFKDFLENLGFYEIRFKILLINTPNITHVSLPTKKNEFLVLLSVPFIRTLNLSKLEISLILFEDFIRNEMGYFKNYVGSKEIEKMFGENFKEKGLDKKLIEKTIGKYDEVVFDKGFDFKQQFAVTKKVSMILKSQMKIWNAYYVLIGKINELVTTNMLYKNYTKIYPSPELQLGWLSSKK